MNIIKINVLVRNQMLLASLKCNAVLQCSSLVCDDAMASRVTVHGIFSLCPVHTAFSVDLPVVLPWRVDLPCISAASKRVRISHLCNLCCAAACVATKIDDVISF